MREISIPLPPKQLMWNVAMTHNESEFLRVGERCARELTAASEAAGVSLLTANRILDWGCGPCRTLRWLLRENSRAQYFGCDVDRRAISWCIRNAGHAAEFRVTRATPPLPYADDFLDVVFGVSVFTHLNSSFQEIWLDELRRVIRPGGLLMLSVMGPSIAAHLPEELRSEYFKQGFLFVPSRTWKGIHSDWYADAYQCEPQVRRVFSKYLDVVAYYPEGMNGHQDLVIMRKRSN